MLKDIVKQSMNPNIIFINHAYFSDQIESVKVVDQTPSWIFTELIAEKLEADLEFQKNIDGKLGNRNKELDNVVDYKDVALKKAKSMNGELKRKGVIIPMFDQNILDSIAQLKYEAEHESGIMRI